MANDRDPWPTMVLLGILCGLAVGAVIVMLFRGNRRPLDAELELGDGDLDALLPSRRRTGARALGFESSPLLAPMRARPLARSTAISASSPTLLFKATGRIDWLVTVRVFGPPGSFATFLIGAEAGNGTMIPAGGHQLMQVPSGEFLYAQGSTTGVQVSVAGGEK